MRKIKFKVWDIKEKKMRKSFHPFELCLQYDGYEHTHFGEDDEHFGDFPFFTPENFILLQYIGLKDKTRWKALTEREQKEWIDNGNKKENWFGKEVYEGDILKDKFGNLQIIKIAFNKNCGCCNNVFGYEFDSTFGIDLTLNGTIYEFIVDGIIIGNIFENENPELSK